MRVIYTILLSAALLFTGCSYSPREEMNAEVEAARHLAERVIPERAGHFVFEQLPDCGKDYFRLEQRGSKLAIGGNNANSMAVGLNYYLKYYCLVEVGWFNFDSFTLPRRLPRLTESVEIEARVDKRFFFNYCTYGYSMPWWGWKEWERMIDWMALNGVNLPLAITGQESIWYQIWTEMGLGDEEVRSYFTGPAHLPWHRMQNIDRWGGPLPQSWLDGQLELQKKITARERELNMKPVLPAFSGHVPAELSRIYPDAPITKLSKWAGYSTDYACSFLDPMSELYTDIQRRFVEKESEIYGSDHIYGLDLFNEVDPPEWNPDYLSRVSRQVYESLQKADSSAVWLQMGWLFYNERENWTNERVKAYLTSFAPENQILLDYYCERVEVWNQTDSFFGVPYIWCYLGNFGGNTQLVGNFHVIESRLENAIANGGANFSGIGSTLEGLDNNPYIYEYVLEKAWNIPQHSSLDEWTRCMADQRTGVRDENARAAWKLMVDSVYTSWATSGQSAKPTVRPSFGKPHSVFSLSGISYDNHHLLEALGLLLKCNGKGSAYGFDLVNIARQMLCNHFMKVFKLYEEAFKAKDSTAMVDYEARMLEMLDEIESLCASQPAFLVGRWIENARAWGKNDAEKEYFEKNARNIITTWSDGNMLLNDYASRCWAGMIDSFYKVRWTMFFDAVYRATDSGEDFDEQHYDAFHKDVTDFEKSWWDECKGNFASKPEGNAVEEARKIYEKYKDLI